MIGLPITVCWSEIPRLPALVTDANSIVIMDTIKHVVLLRGIDIAVRNGIIVFDVYQGATMISVATKARVASPIGTFVKVTVAVV
jgi:hypothetical protein